MRYTDGLPSQNSLSSEFPSVSSVCTKPNARRAAVCAHLPNEACAGHTVLTAVLSHGTVRDLAHRLLSVIDIHADYDEPSTTYNIQQSGRGRLYQNGRERSDALRTPPLLLFLLHQVLHGASQ
jgi:hypothetical protein